MSDEVNRNNYVILQLTLLFVMIRLTMTFRGLKKILILHRCTPDIFILHLQLQTFSFLMMEAHAPRGAGSTTFIACQSHHVICPGPMQGGFEGLVNTLQIFPFDGLLIAPSSASPSDPWLLQKWDIGVSPIARTHNRSFPRVEFRIIFQAVMSVNLNRKGKN